MSKRGAKSKGATALQERPEQEPDPPAHAAPAKRRLALRVPSSRGFRRPTLRDALPVVQAVLATVRGTLRSVPRAAWICAAIAFANAACWSLLTPPFQFVDEQTHFAYTQQLAENHSLPTSSESTFSPEEETVLRDTRQYNVRQSPETHTIASAGEQRRLEEDLKSKPPRQGEGGVGGSYNDPPLYYAAETVPYVLASGGTLLDQLETMRLLSALMGALTALFVFLFLREALPGAPWAASAAAIAVAIAPLLGFVSGAVTPEAMLAAESAAIFYCLARGFRRGLTRPLAVAIGLLTAAGFLTKLNFIGVAPGIGLGLIVLSVRAVRTQGRSAYASLGIALALAAAPVWIYVLGNLASGHPGLGVASTVLKLHGAGGSILAKLSYAWQLFLPRLPGMTDYFPGLFAPRDLWFNRGVGFYGWLDTSFPAWVNSAALIPAAILALLCLRALIAERRAALRRAGELCTYAVMGIGLLGLIGVTSYIDRKEGIFSDPRYLLPALPILAAGLALAARGAGRRWGYATGALIVGLFIAHDVFSQLLVVGRFYG